jgi:lipopolysaccharide transport system permease protein
VTVNSRAQANPFAGVVPALRDLASHWELFRMLVIKDLRIKYKASALGLGWSLLNPLLMMAIYSVIFGALLGGSKPQFPIYVLSGLLAWNFFGTALPSATLSIVGSANLIKKTRFPTALLPLSIVSSGLINYLISLVLLAGLLVFYRHPVGLSLLLLPVVILAQFVFTAGLSLLLSSLNVLFRDIEHFLGILLTVWFFATPIIYPRNQLQGSRLASLIIQVNPMTWCVEAYQNIFYGSADPVAGSDGKHFLGTFTTVWPNYKPLLGFIALAVILFVVGFITFIRLAHRFPEEV